MNIDSQFSKLSEAVGVNAAFLSYLADDGVLLRKDSFPIFGKEIIKERFFSRSDSGYTLDLETFVCRYCCNRVSLVTHMEFMNSRQWIRKESQLLEMEPMFLFGRKINWEIGNLF